MMRRIIVASAIIVGTLCFRSSSAEVSSGRLSVTDQEIIERLTRLEEGQKALNQRIDDVNENLSKR
ncbi:MAG TPA: hypothetical protein EYP53_10045, partial [Candidatus Latescibacteria bacterium]|nr:hypothetical protein [Candidatus Latescibacterota bacterium]